jgi:serine/threonine-protein kinase
MKHCSVCKAKYDDSVSFCPVDGEVLEEDLSSLVGTVLDGQYQIDAMLGKGGMGAVYRARHILLGDRVAIKILPPEVRNNAEWLRRFRREGQAARRFRHPNAVTVYDLRTAADGVIYMVMEYVEGHTLDAELRRRGRLSAADAFTVLEPIMSVLNTAHSMGVVHRDLKPENIMIGKATNGEQTIKLLDLGIAKMREIAEADSGGTTALTIAGQVLGTPYYMSPEQWGEIPNDGNAEIDGRADIYSLGLVFYELVAGKRPYTGTTLPELRRQHIQVVPAPLDQAVPGVPNGFSQAIARAISKDRGDRQSTAGELSAQLRSTLGSRSEFSAIGQPGQTISSTQTDIANVRGTSSDIAPTVITVEASGLGPVTPPPVPIVEKPLPAATEFELPLSRADTSSTATVIERSDMASSVTIPQAPNLRAAPSRSNRPILLGIGLLVFLLIAGVVGFIAFKWMNSTSTVAGTTPSSNTSQTEKDSTAVSLEEVGRYWLEVEPRPGAESIQASGLEALDSGQSLKFHFAFENDGYVYIVGPGQGNQLTAFLTAKPAEQTGLKDNKVSGGVDLSFPKGSGNWLTLDKNPGIENYTIVFSTSQESVPSFLNREFIGTPLNAAEQQELASFLNKYRENKAATELKSGNSATPFVAIKASNSAGDNPIFFEIRIEHK